MEDDNRDFVSLVTTDSYACPNMSAARPAAAPEHPVPGLDAGAGRGAGRLRAGVGHRRALLRARDRPAEAAAAQLRGDPPSARAAVVEQGAPRVLRGRCGALRLVGPRPPRGIDDRRPLERRLGRRRGQLAVGAVPLPGPGDDRCGRHRVRAQRRQRHRHRDLHRHAAAHRRVAGTGARPGPGRVGRLRHAVGAAGRRLGPHRRARQRRPRGLPGAAAALPRAGPQAGRALRRRAGAPRAGRADRRRGERTARSCRPRHGALRRLLGEVRRGPRRPRPRPDPGRARSSRSSTAGGSSTRSSPAARSSAAPIGGIGHAIFEETIFDAGTGRIANPTFGDYLIPVNADVPDIDVVLRRRARIA